MEHNFLMTSASVTDRGLSDKRPQNEDSYLELPQSGLFAVADGVGGAQAGDVASQMAVEILSEAFINMRQNGDAEEVMKIGIDKANSSIFQMSNELSQLATMATTIVALHLQGNIATVGHVGDSRLYRLDGKGNLYRETQDHSIVEEEVRAGRMTAAQAAHHPSRNIISRALGSESTVEIDLKTIMFEPDTAFLLCSDGITRHLEDYEIRNLLNSDAPPSGICAQMKKLCYERGAEDNLTAVVIKISGEVVPAPEQITPAVDTDLEESTVATPRQTFETVAPMAAGADLFEENETRDLKLPDNFSPPVKTAPLTVAESNAPAVNVPEVSQTKVIAPIINDAVPAAPFEKVREVEPATAPEIVKDEKTYRIEDNSKSGFFSRLVNSLLLLITGAILGVAIYYFAVASQVQTPPPVLPPPPITQMESPNIAYTALENNRRDVDKNPEGFIRANAAAPQSAEDYFLLGRAYLLTRNYAEAKKALTEASNRLSQVSDVNSQTLATEIAISMTIISDPTAQQLFEKELAAIKPNAPAASANTAGNANTVNTVNSANVNR